MEETTKSLKNIFKIVSMQVSLHWHVDTGWWSSRWNLADRSWLSDGDWCIATSHRFKPWKHWLLCRHDTRVSYRWCTRLEPTQYAYGGIVDYMIIYTDRPTRGLSGYRHFALSFSNSFQTLSCGFRSLPFCLMKSASSYLVAFTKQRQSQILLCRPYLKLRWPLLSRLKV